MLPPLAPEPSAYSYTYYKREVTPRRLLHGLNRLARLPIQLEDLPKIHKLMTAEEFATFNSDQPGAAVLS